MDVLNVGFNLPVSGPLYPDPPYYYRGAKIVLGVYEADATRVARHLPPGVTVLEDPAVCIAWVCTYPFTTFGTYNEAILLVRTSFEGEGYSYCPFIYVDAEAPMADFGADVIKIERPGGGDLWRLWWVTPGTAQCEINYSWLLTSRNKKSLALDLAREEGREALLRLVKTADVFVTNYQASLLSKFRLTFEDLSAVNPRLVFAHVTGYGEAGEDADAPAFDALAYWARSGLMTSVTGADGSPAMEAQVQNATDSLHRLEPLLPEFVTPEKVDQARTAKLTAQAGLDEARQKMDQAEKDVGDLISLRAKRDAGQVALGKAELDLSFCSVRAQFDALVVNLHTAIGAFVTPGPTPVFSLVDTRAWYVVANYRETELKRITPGMEAEVYVLTDPQHHFRGTVQGVGWAVNPEDQPIVSGLPQIKRELNWVHIAQRFPVRIRIDNPQPPQVFRVGASAVAIIRGRPADRGADAPG